ncbi:MAG: tRNA uridine-5-carboxymethylaminomethyl(34) synthesis GTPase MnmE, partial [Muribaculaceae bacterium]|nr:tRNA uridine-5-carboxymethylaminomethyl(34) synthesis GTPase MnmE [Muribaculaceae bacterium]
MATKETIDTKEEMISSRLDEDTICAISTPAGVGGIAVARVSGPDAIKVCDKIWRGKSLESVLSHTAHLGRVIDSEGNELDEAVGTVYRAPRSFTGEDVVELSVHGSIYIQRELIDTLCDAGARLADRGEFTRRAF